MQERSVRLALWVVLAGLLACTEDGGALDRPLPTDPADPEPEASAASLPGLRGQVEVLVDERGMPHIYGASQDDVLLVQGYLMARDRFVQMEFLRRNVTGTLAALAGDLDPTLVESDRTQRVLGFQRQGRALYESLAADDPTRRAAEAFVAGVNLYLDEVRAGTAVFPRGAEVMDLVRDRLTDWHPADVFSLARFQAFSLTHSASQEIQLTQALVGARAAFVADDPRVGVFADLWSFAPARDVPSVAGFAGGDTKHTAPAVAPAIAPASLAGAARFFRGSDAILARWVGDESRGSNNWVVSGAHTASGQPLLASDPHLTLTSPSLWWYAHLDTVRAGGELEVQGITFAGLPGVTLGYNRDVSWGATVTNFDVTDVYHELIVPAEDGGRDFVRFRDGLVRLEVVTEVIEVAGGEPVIVELERVPHHGIIIPDSRTATEALSIRYVGDELTNEMAGFMALTQARDADDVMTAFRSIEAAGQNFVGATRQGDIVYSSYAYLPVRDARTCTFSIDDRGRVSGTAPVFVLSGQGDHEWTGERLSPEVVPFARNPSQGFVASANQDNSGTVSDGNPCNDPSYLGALFVPGHRMGRIDERLRELVARGNITAEDMMELQHATRSSLGETMRDALLASLDRAIAAAASPGDYPDLAALVAERGAADMARLVDVRARLAAWSLETPHGVGATDADVVADSIATTLFNAGLVHLVPLAFGDELEHMGVSRYSAEAVRAIGWAVADPDRLATYRPGYGLIYGVPEGDTVLWDDLTTPAMESRHERIARAFLDALDFLDQRLGADMGDWRWGRLHTVRFQAIAPQLGPDVLSIPSADEHPDGFPRNGDIGAVDVGDFSLWGTSFSYGHGPSQRLVVEMNPTGPSPYNSLPGGQSQDPDSPHFDDEAHLWAENRQPPLWFEHADVRAHTEAMQRFGP